MCQPGNGFEFKQLPPISSSLRDCSARNKRTKIVQQNDVNLKRLYKDRYGPKFKHKHCDIYILFSFIFCKINKKYFREMFERFLS